MTIETEMDDLFAGRPDTIGALLAWRIEQTPHALAYRYRGPNEDAWSELDWTQTGDIVNRLAAGLLSLGLKLEDRVAICSSTRVEWILADLAINTAGGATTSIYPNTKGEAYDHVVLDSGSRILFVEDSEQLAKLRVHPQSEAQLDAIIVMDGDGDGASGVYTWDELCARGDEALAADPDMVRRAIDSVDPMGLATLVYTSGTTGQAKGAELTHRGWCYEGYAVEKIHIIRPTDTQFLWLPLSHAFGKAIATCQLAIGFSQAVDGRIDRIVDGMGEVKPQVMCGAPRIFEKVRSTVFLSATRGSIKGRVARWAFAIGRDSRPYRLAGEPLPFFLRLAYAVADRLVFKKLRETVGGNIDLFISGSAKLSEQVQAWFYSAGILVVEGYGLTETSAISFVNRPQEPRFGTVGPPLPGTQAQIADDGEILIKSPAVMRGYHNNPEGTAEALTDGWFHTGDIGRLDEAGHLIITDRKKDVMKTSGGKYVSPASVEGAVSAAIPYVSQVVAVGDGRKYVSVLLTMDHDNVMTWAERHDAADQPYEAILENPAFRETISRGIERANAQLERWETVKQFAILPSEFGIDDGGVTPSLKVRRSIVSARFASVIDSLYDDDPGAE